MSPQTFERIAFLKDRLEELYFWARLEGRGGPARKATAIVLRAIRREVQRG